MGEEHGQESPSVVKTFYEDDNDDDLHNSELSPLITSDLTTDSPRGKRSSKRLSLHRTNDSSDHSLHPLHSPGQQHHGGEQVRQPLAATWKEWLATNGLHPKTWTKQTYLRTLLLATLLTLVILAFTVFRVQDHIKDILQ